jgi:AcrR family transcriptional regulator
VAKAKQEDAPGRRELRRQQQQDLSRQQLLDAAEEVFSLKGYHDATLKEIADVAEFSVGSVYSFFENKDDLFFSVFLRRGDQLLPAMRDVLEGEGAPLEQLHALIDLQIGFFRQHALFARLFLRTSSTVSLSTERPVDQVMRTRFTEAMDLEADLFARGQAAGQFRDGAPHVLSLLFSNLISAYQATDPEIMGSDVDGEPLPLAALHDLVEAAFVAPGVRRR